MTKNPAYFGEAYDICTRFGLLPLMGLHENYSDDLVAQFYSTVAFHGDNDDEITWMTLDKKLKSTWQDFGNILGYPPAADGTSVGWKVHIGQNASRPDVLAPLYIPGWGHVGEVAHLQSTWDIMNRVYLNTIAPKSGNYDQIHAWSIDQIGRASCRERV